MRREDLMRAPYRFLKLRRGLPPLNVGEAIIVVIDPLPRAPSDADRGTSFALMRIAWRAATRGGSDPKSEGVGFPPAPYAFSFCRAGYTVAEQQLPRRNAFHAP